MKIKKRRYIQFVLAMMTLGIIITTMLVNSPRVQKRVSVILATELENRIGTRVNLGGVRWLFPNDIVIDSLAIDDQEGEQILSVNSVAAKIEWMPLIKEGKISIRNIRLFNPHIAVYKNTPESDANYQFLIDAFASKKEKKESTKLNLRINSLLIRHAHFKYNVHSEDATPDKFNPNHIGIDDLSAHLSLKALTNDTLSAMVRHLEMKEKSGLKVNDMYLRLVGNRHGATLANFRLELPHSNLQLDTIWASFSINTPNNPVKGSKPTTKLNNLIVKGKTQPSHITPSDLGALIPMVKQCNEKVYLSTNFIGSPTRINLKEFEIYTKNRDISLNTKGMINLLSNKNKTINIDLQEASVTNKTWHLIEKQIPDLYCLIPPEITRLGNITFRGQFRSNKSKSAANLNINSDAGTLEVYADIDNQGHYTANIDATDINLYKIIPSIPLTQANITLQTTGTANDQYVLTDKQRPTFDGFTISGTFNGTATHTNFLGYEYQSIAFRGDYAPNIYNANVILNDPNGKLSLEAQYDSRQALPQYTANITADSINLYALNLIDIHENNSFSARLNGDITGADFDHMVGNIKIDSLTQHSKEGDYMVSPISIYSFEPEIKSLTINSDFLEADIRGDFTYQSLAHSLMTHLHNYLPSICPSHSHTHTYNNNICHAELHINNTTPLQKLFLIPISIDKEACTIVKFNDSTKNVALSIQIPQLTYNKKELTDIALNCNADGEKADIKGLGTLYNEDTNITANINATVKEDILSLNTDWESNPISDFTGAFSTNVQFARNIDKDLEISILSDSSHTTINQSLWNLYPFEAHITPKKISISKFRFEHDAAQYIDIDGTIADTHSDTLHVTLNDIDLNYLLSLVKLQGISFGGDVSGNIKVSDLYTSSPYLDANVNVKKFSFCNGTMGDAKAHAYWDQDSTRLQFKARVNETPNHTTLVNGYADFADQELWIDILADSTNVSFLDGLLSSFMGDVVGNAYGHLSIGGPMNAIDLNGALLTEAAFNLTPTNARYMFKDTLRFTPGKILFRGIEARDLRNQKAIVNGSVTHNKLKDFGYNLHVDAQNVLGIDLPNTGNDSFYTTIYGTGEVNVSGGPNMPLKIDIMAQPEAGSLFALNLASQDITSSEAFITFVDRTPKRNATPNSQTRRTRSRRQSTGNSEQLVMNISTNITPEATLKLVMNQATDDNISVRGSGDLQIGINEDEINLFGTYTANRGSYTLNLQDFITKKFDVIDGSTVTFDGDPMTARLNITACHTVNQTPLRDLNPEATDNVRVNCLLKIGGTLNKPTISFDLELPQGTEEEKAILRSFTSTEEQTNLQFIYLLGLGKFYTMDIANASETEGIANMESLLTSTISNQINNLLSNIIHSDNWDIASNIRTNNTLYGEDNSWDNMEIGGILEGRLLNNKLLINGNFSYRDNPMYASNFIGDFDVRYLLSNSLSIKGYNKTNDRYFTKTALTTQGIGLLFQRDFNNLFQSRKRKPTTPAPNSLDSTSVTISDTIQ